MNVTELAHPQEMTFTPVVQEFRERHRSIGKPELPKSDYSHNYSSSEVDEIMNILGDKIPTQNRDAIRQMLSK